jgi:hypothetical protein
VKLDLAIRLFVFAVKLRSLGPVPPVFPIKKQDEKVTLQVVPDGDSIKIAPYFPGSEPSLNKQLEKATVPDNDTMSKVLTPVDALFATKSQPEIVVADVTER